MNIEELYAAAQQMHQDMPHLFKNNHFVRKIIATHPTNIELTDPDYDVFKIRCEDFILEGGTFGSPRLVQFDALGSEQDMIDYHSQEIGEYYKSVLDWRNIRRAFLNLYSPETYWLHIWQTLFEQNIGNRPIYKFDQLFWLADSQMSVERKLLCLAAGLVEEEDYKPLADAPDMYLMTLMSVPSQGRYHQYKNEWQPEHGPFMPLRDAGLRDPIMHKLINEGKIALTFSLEAD